MIKYIGDNQPENLEKYIPILQAISAAQYQLSLLLLTLYLLYTYFVARGNKIGVPIAYVMWDYYALHAAVNYEQLVITPNSVLYYIPLLFDEPFM